MIGWLRHALFVAAVFLACTIAVDSLARPPSADDRAKWGKELVALYDRALANDRAALLELERRAAAEDKIPAAKRSFRRHAEDAFGAAIEAVAKAAGTNAEARRVLLLYAPSTKLDYRVALAFTDIGEQLLAKPSLSPQEVVDLAIILGAGRLYGKDEKQAAPILAAELAKGNLAVRDALGAAVRGNSMAFAARDLLKAHYEKADPKTLTYDDYVNIALIDSSILRSYDGAGKVLEAALRADAPGARDAIRDLLADRVPGVDLDARDQFARGRYAETLIEVVGKKKVTYQQRPTQYNDGKYTRDIPNFSVADEDALAYALPRLREYDGRRVKEALDAWKGPAAHDFDRKVEAEIVPLVKAYVHVKKESANAQFKALQDRIQAAGAQGEISQAQADAFRKELFDLAAKVAVENQSGAVRVGDTIITPGYLAQEIVERSETERFLWGGPSPFGGLKIAREDLAALDRLTIEQIQNTAGLILSKDERIALEDAIIKENQALLRDQMAEQMRLLTTTFQKVTAPVNKPPSGPITVLQDFLKYQIGSENSYVAMVDRLLPIYDDFDPMFRLVPKKGQPLTPAAYREFMARRDALIERIRKADERVAGFIESQKAWKDGITSVGAVTVAGALAIPTGGQSLWIAVPAVAGGGAATKVGLSWGDDYLGGRSYTLKDGFKDGVIGAVDGVSVLAGGALSTSARNLVGKRIGLGLLEKGLQRELNMQGATILQRFLVHGVTTTTRGATFGAMTGFTRSTYDAVERISAGKERFGVHTLGEIASATALSTGAGALLDFGLSSTFAGVARLLPKRANGALDAESEALLWRLLGSEKPGDLAAANAALKAKFPQGFGSASLTQEQALALEAYARLVSAKQWAGDPAAMKLQILAPKVSPTETLVLDGTMSPSPDIFRPGVQVRVPRSSGAIDEGWRIDAINPDGSIRVSTRGAYKALKPEQLLEHNPELLRGLPVRTTRTSGVVEENWAVESVDPRGLMLVQPSTGLRRIIPRGELGKFIAQNADRWSPSSASRITPEQLRLAEARVPDGPARQVSEAFRKSHRLEPSTKVPDGYADGGRGMHIGPDGVASSPREILVVDRTRDAALQRHLEVARDLGAKVKAGKMGEEAAYRELAQYIDRLTSPGGQRDAAHAAMNKWLAVAEGREVLIGDVTRLEAGMCRHRSLLFKVLGDELSATSGKGEVALVRGNLVYGGGQGGHAWNELVLSDGRKVLVDIMNPKEGFRFPELSEAAAAYRKVDGSPFYSSARGGGAVTDLRTTMVMPRVDDALVRARALADVMEAHPVGALTSREATWAAIRAAEDRGVGDLFRAEIKRQLVRQLDAIERIRTMPGRGSEALAEQAQLASKAKAAGFSLDDIKVALGAERKVQAELAAEVARAQHGGVREYPKHFKGKTDADAARLSQTREGGDPVGQFLPSKYGPSSAGDAARAELERAALLDPRAVRVQNGGALHVYWEAPDIVGYSNGQPTRWMRVELSGGFIHSHPRLPELFPAPVREAVRVNQILFGEGAQAGTTAAAAASPGGASAPRAAPPPVAAPPVAAAPAAGRGAGGSSDGRIAFAAPKPCGMTPAPPQ